MLKHIIPTKSKQFSQIKKYFFTYLFIGASVKLNVGEEILFTEFEDQPFEEEGIFRFTGKQIFTTIKHVEDICFPPDNTVHYLYFMVEPKSDLDFLGFNRRSGR